MKSLSAIAFLCFSIVFSVFANKPMVEENTTESIDVSCFSVPVKSTIIQQILMDKMVENYLELTKNKREPVKIFKNQYIGPTIDVRVHRNKALLIDNPSRYPEALLIDFKKMNCNKQTLEFILMSRTKGVTIQGGLRRDEKNNIWEVQVFTAHKNI